MAGKSGRSINNVPESPVKKMIFSWEGILVLLFIAVNIFCAMFSEYYNVSSLLRQMPVYLAEVFMMLPMAYILVLGEIDISVGAIVCLSATMSCSSSYSAGCWYSLWCNQRIHPYQIPGTASDDRNTGNTDHLPRNF